MIKHCLVLVASVCCATLSNFSLPAMTKQSVPELGAASWITDAAAAPAADSLFYIDHPAPLFRKEFRPDNPDIIKAVLFISAAGYYTATLNGSKIGDAFLDPAWTDVTRRIYYSEFDITAAILQGDNCLGITLGNGFYNPLPLRMWGNLNLREKIPNGRPACIARLLITYADGRQQELVTDASWHYGYGPVRKNNVYLGIVYDGRHECPGWDQPGYGAADWPKAVVCSGPGGRLQKAFFPAIRNTRNIKPVRMVELSQDRFLADFGENFAGLYSIRMHGRPGDSVVFRFGERIYENGELNPMTAVCGQIKRKGQGGAGAPDVAWQQDVYVFGSERDIHFTPDFTFHTFRYMEITGLRYKPDSAEITGLVLHTDVEPCNSFSCSSDVLNQIQRMTARTFLCNLFSVQSDCPARERFGYGGDLNAVSESYICNFDMQSFYRKTIYDWIDAIRDSGFVDTAPFIGLAYCGISWESAFLITQYHLYVYYNDLDLVREMYPFNLQWIAKVARLHPEGLVEKGLSDHEALIPSTVTLTGTVHYLQCARIMARFAHLMNDKTRRVEFTALADGLREKLRQQFWRQPADPATNKQTLYSALLYFDVLAEPERHALEDSLRSAIAGGIAGHFTTGIFGTKYILEAASRAGLAGTVFDIVGSSEFPGWGYMLGRGATTLWETWQESDNVYSNCHPMFGMVSEWFYRWLAGIRPDPDHPGFNEFSLAPCLPADLQYVTCSYRCPFGIIQSNWQRTAEGVQFDLVVPPGTRARFQIAVAKNSSVTVVRDGKTINRHEQVAGPNWQRALTAGTYSIVVRTRPGTL